MQLSNGLAVMVLFAIGATATVAQTQDLETEYNDALNTFLKEGGEAALPKLESLVANRWGELSPMGKHGVLTITMFCELGTGRLDDALEHGAWLHEELPEAFSSLADFSASDVPAPEIGELRGSIQLLSMMAARGESVLYLHNSSDRPIELSDMNYDVAYGYETRTDSVGDIRAQDSNAFGATLLIPAGKGKIIKSTSEGQLSARSPDFMALIACATKDRLPGWIHLSKGGYTQTLRRVHITADVRWGDQELKRAPLARYDDPTNPVVEETTPARDINEEYQEAFDTFLGEGVEAGLPKFQSLIDNRWKEMSPIGKHGAVTAAMVCNLGVGKSADARKLGAWFHGQLPQGFSSLADFSASDTPSPEVARLRSSIQLLSLMTAQGESLLYMHNASDEPIEIMDSEYDVAYGYESASSSVGNLSSSSKLAFTTGLQLPPGGGVILRSVTGSSILSAALPDCVTIIACATKDRLPGWHHLSMGGYAQTLRKVHIWADVKWGDDVLKQAALAWYDAPAVESEDGAAKKD